MNKKNLNIAGVICFITLLLNFQMALAHEAITVGDYTLEIGWLSEPPIIGQQNAIVVNVSTTSDEQTVEDVSGLTVAVSYGGQSKTLTLQPLGEDTPGQFVAPILPTVPGEYTINLGGKLGGTDVKADVQPEEVQSSDTLAFPSQRSAEESAGSEMSGWVSWIALIAGLVGIALGVIALSKAR
jgi:hypothetical protein